MLKFEGLANSFLETITDIQGRLITVFQLKNQFQIDVYNLASGVYCLRLPDGEVLKVVKE